MLYRFLYGALMANMIRVGGGLTCPWDRAYALYALVASALTSVR